MIVDENYNTDISSLHVFGLEDGVIIVLSQCWNVTKYIYSSTVLK